MASQQQFSPTIAWPDNNPPPPPQIYPPYNMGYRAEADTYSTPDMQHVATKTYYDNPPPPSAIHDPERAVVYDPPENAAGGPLSAPYDDSFEPQTLNCCWCIVPLFALVCSFAIGGGIGLWYYYVRPGFDNTLSAVTDIGLKTDFIKKHVHKSFNPIIIVESILAFFLLVLSNIRIFKVASYIKKGVPNWNYSSWLTSASFLYFCLQHILQLWFVVLLVVHTLWFVGVFGGHKVFPDLSTTLTEKLGLVQSTASEVTGFNATWSSSASTACTPLFYSAANPFVMNIANDVSSTSTVSHCPFSCIDLGNIPMFNSSLACLCDGTRFSTASVYLDKGWKEVGYATLGVLISYFGCTLVGLNTVNAFSRERRKMTME
mmetsp:Transcript_30353/g.55466  ORF Transcript_30353/g.55466 Transcript_30353/m.55466 type:complete len:374 (-) Transcript_30353:1959-3080(-)